jgi:hypothetical protein
MSSWGEDEFLLILWIRCSATELPLKFEEKLVSKVLFQQHQKRRRFWQEESV